MTYYMETSLELLNKVEAAADNARRQGAEHLATMGHQWTRAMDVPTTQLVASLLIGGVVKAVPNLTHQGERVAGLLTQENSEFKLEFELYEPVVRQRFSIGHELGHYFLHIGQPEISAPGLEKPDIESEADAFAAALLIPRDELRQDLAEFGPSTAFLAQRYNVSEAALKSRLQILKVLIS